MRARGHTLGILAVAFVVALAPAARADDDAHAESQRYYRAGSAAYRSGQYLVAVRALEEAYRLAPTPGLAFSLAQACRRQYFVDGDRRLAERAVELYRSYLDAVPSGGRRAHAVTHIAALEVVLAGNAPPAATPPPPPSTQILVVSDAPSALARVDGGEPKAVPATFDVVAGDHDVEVSAPGHVARTSRWLAVAERLVVAQIELPLAPGRLTVDAPRGATVLVDGEEIAGRRVVLAPGIHVVSVLRAGHRPFRRRVTLAPDADVGVTARLAITPRRRASYYVLGASGGVLLAGLATAGLALDADASASRLQDASRVRSLTDGERRTLNDSIDRRDTLRTTSLVLVGLAAAGGTAAALLYANDDPAREAPRVAPLAGGGAIGLTLQGAF